MASFSASSWACVASGLVLGLVMPELVLVSLLLAVSESPPQAASKKGMEIRRAARGFSRRLSMKKKCCCEVFALSLYEQELQIRTAKFAYSHLNFCLALFRGLLLYREHQSYSSYGLEPLLSIDFPASGVTAIRDPGSPAKHLHGLIHKTLQLGRALPLCCIDQVHGACRADLSEHMVMHG